MPETPEVPQDFDGWRRLAADPEQFEAARRRCIEEAIARAPTAQQERLRRLQWRIDHTRRRAGSPLGACVALSRMMWESLAGAGGLLDALQGRDLRRRARVVPFRRGGIP